MRTRRIDAIMRELAELRAQAEIAEEAMAAWAQEYLQLIEAIPGSTSSDGTGPGITPLGWVEWAKRQLVDNPHLERSRDG